MRPLAKHSAAGLLLCLTCASPLSAQIEAVHSVGRLPKFVLLVHQQFKPESTETRQKLEVEMARGFERFDVSLQWIETEALTGRPGALFIDPFDSYDELDRAGGILAGAYSQHPELARLQHEIDNLISDSKTVIGVRRDDLSCRPEKIDLSKARYFRVDVLHVLPGREADFAQASKMSSAAHQRINSALAWAVYEVDAGTTRPTFLVFTPMHALKEGDDLLAAEKRIQQTDSATSGLLHEIARDTFSSVETNFYAVSPNTSHVSREFAAGDPQFWKPRSLPNPATKPSAANKQ